MKAKITEHLLDRLAGIFGKPKNTDRIAEELAKVADPGLTEADLGELAANIIANRKTKGFPSPSELMVLLKAVPEMKRRGGGSSNKARTGLFDPLTKTGLNKGPHEKRTNETGYRIGGVTRYFGYGSHATNLRHEALAEAEYRALSFLWGTELAKRAIAERWAPALIDFAITEGRAPQGDEEGPLIALCRRNDVDVRDFVDKPDPVPIRGNVPGGSTFRHIGAGLGDALRKMRPEMHAAAARRLSVAPPNQPSSFRRP